MKTILTTFIACISLTATNYLEAASFEVDKTTSSITVKAKATGGGFTGTLKDYKATIMGDAKTLKPASAKLTWLFKDLDTDEKKRDAKMLEWLDTGKFPGGEFTLDKVFTKTVLNKTQTYALGQITIHGVTKRIVFPLTTKQDGKTLNISGQAALNTKDFDLPIIRMALVATVKPELVIDFSLNGSIK